jgi:3-oxoacyl-[acyl-carrier-protein] synthase II
VAGPRRVVITGIGPVTPIGLGRRAFWDALMAGRSGITSLEGSPGLPVRVGGRVEGFRPQDHMDPKAARRTSRFVHLAVAAANLAWEDAGRPEVPPARAGVIVSSALAGIDRIVAQHGVLTGRGPDRLSAFAIPSVMANAAPAQIAIDLGLAGANFSVSSDDAGGIQAVGEGHRYVQEGILDVCLVGGTEAPLVPVVLAALAGTGTVASSDDPVRASRPFDSARGGFVPAEGACILVLEEAEHARRRGARAHAELAGYAIGGAGSDEALGVQVVQSALAVAGVGPAEVDLVIAGAPSTIEEDVREARVLRKALGDRASAVPVTAPRSLTGHLLGASGAVDAAVGALALRSGVVPATANLEDPDPACDLDHVRGEVRRIAAAIALVDGVARSGQHAALILRAA